MSERINNDLQKILGEAVELDPPKSRIEKILYKILGYEIELDEPKSRTEKLLMQLAENPPGPGPTGEISITENGNYDVKDYATAAVNVGDALDDFLAGTLKEYTNADVIRIEHYQMAGYSSADSSYRMALSLPNVRIVNSYGFQKSAIKTCNMPLVTNFGEMVFESSSLTEVDFPELSSIGGSTFQGCSYLTKVNLPKLENWGNYTFSRCSALQEVDIPLMAEFAGYGQFSKCTALTEIPNADFVTLLGNACFSECTGLTEAKLPKAHTLQQGAFSRCTALKKVLINSDASQVGSIGQQAFYLCGQLETLVIPNTTGVTTLGTTNAFSGTKIQDGSGYIYVPATLIDTYKTATNWLVFADQFRAIEDYPDVVNW